MSTRENSDQFIVVQINEALIASEECCCFCIRTRQSIFLYIVICIILIVVFILIMCAYFTRLYQKVSDPLEWRLKMSKGILSTNIMRNVMRIANKMSLLENKNKYVFYWQKRQSYFLRTTKEFFKSQRRTLINFLDVQLPYQRL